MLTKEKRLSLHFEVVRSIVVLPLPFVFVLVMPPVEIFGLGSVRIRRVRT